MHKKKAPESRDLRSLVSKSAPFMDFQDREAGRSPDSFPLRKRRTDTTTAQPN
jgi:hypothetical protein